MTDFSIEKTDITFSLLSKIAAGVVFISFVVGMSYAHGWYRAFGLLGGQYDSQEFLSLLGFLLSFSLLQQIITVLLMTFLNWKVWVGGLAMSAVMIGVMKLKKYSDNEEFQRFSWKGFKTSLVLLFVLMLPVEASNLGRNNAEEKLVNLLETGCDSKKNGWNKCHSVILNAEVLMRGYLIAQRGQKVYMIELNKKELISFLVPSEAKIIRSYHSNIAKQVKNE